MTRISKQSERRNQSPKKRVSRVVKKTGPLKDNLPEGYKMHANALEGDIAKRVFIPKIS